MNDEILKKIQKKNNDILKKIQDEGLAILKLHDKLNELNIEHEFIDRKEKSISLESDKKMGDIINNIVPFSYQIFIKENGNKISLIQSPYSYGIRENLIEVYNFSQEPIVLCHEMAAVLINKKKLNSFIIDCNDKNAEEVEKIAEEVEKIKEALKLLIESENLKYGEKQK